MSEPWENITAYGRADMTLHPVLKRAYRVACLIERCGASIELTDASSAAFYLCEELSDAFKQQAAEIASRDATIAELRDKAIKYGLDAIGIEQRYSESVELVEVRAERAELIAERDALRSRAEAALSLADDLLEDLELNGLHDSEDFHYRSQKARYAAIAAGGSDAKDL